MLQCASLGSALGEGKSYAERGGGGGGGGGRWTKILKVYEEIFH